MADALPVRAGLTLRQIQALKAWATKRVRYGDSGRSEAGRVRHQVALQACFAAGNHNNARKTHCKRGHLYTPANTYRDHKGARNCVTCRRIGRPAWVEQDGCRISITAHDRYYRREYMRLREEMIAAHPDKSRRRTSAAFIAARRRLEQFLDAERQWYALCDLKPPTRRQVQRSQAA